MLAGGYRGEPLPFEAIEAVRLLCAADAMAVASAPTGASAPISGYRYGGAAVAAATVGAAAAGAYYRGGCGYDAYGNWVCPDGY